MTPYDILGRFIVIAGLTASINFACQSTETTQNESDSPNKHLPWPIKVPDGAEIEQDGSTEFSIRKGITYGIKLSQMDLDEGHQDSLWAREKRQIMDLPGFKRFITQEDSLWFYEMAPEQSQSHYGFRMLKKIDNNWWICESALAGSWDSMQVAAMIQSLQ